MFSILEHFAELLSWNWYIRKKGNIPEESKYWIQIKDTQLSTGYKNIIVLFLVITDYLYD